MRLLFSIVFFAACQCISAQQRVIVSGRVTDQTNNQPIQNVGVYEQGREHYKIPTDEKGIFHIPVKHKTKTTLVFRHLGYERYYYTLTDKDFSRIENDTIHIRVSLRQNVEMLDTFVVIASKPDTVFGSTLYSVSDYEFLQGRLVLLGYEKQLTKGGYIMLPDAKGNILSKQLIPDEAVRLFRSFRNEVFVVGKTTYYQVLLRADVISLLPIEKEIYEGFHAIVNDTLEENFYYSNYSDLYPAFTYYCSQLNDTVRHVLHEIRDQFMMELYRSEYKYVDGKTKLWAAKQEVKTGIDKEIWVGAASFTQSLYYKTLYAPLFVSRDTVLIFDHHSDYLYRYNVEHKLLDSIPISYHKSKGSNQWEKPLIKDPKTQKIYTVFLKGAHFYLKEIIPTTGEVVQVIKLHYRFVDNIRVYEGKVYYVYRPFESSQRKFLYSERVE